MYMPGANVSSAQVSWFNIKDRQPNEPLSQRQCWFAPPGTQVSDGEWVVYREIFKAWVWRNNWDFGGRLRNQVRLSNAA